VAKVVWTEQAYEDREAIFEYVSHDSLKYARLLIEKILLAIKRLETFPESGRMVPERNERDIREVIVGRYRVVYRTRDSAVEILMIRHSATHISIKAIDERL
jgi:addiction module RelE/StbE family toxin